MYILNFDKAIEKMSISEIREFIFKNYNKKIVFSKKSSYYSMKQLKKKRFIVAGKQINRKNI